MNKLEVGHKLLNHKVHSLEQALNQNGLMCLRRFEHSHRKPAPLFEAINAWGYVEVANGRHWKMHELVDWLLWL